MRDPGGDGTRPAEITERLLTAWREARIDDMNALLSDDVVVSGYLAQGVPIRGKDAVAAMVRDFAATGSDLQLSDIEELSDSAVVLRASVRGGAGDPDGSSSYWLWAFQDGMLKESHAFTSREAALVWFDSLDPGE